MLNEYDSHSSGVNTFNAIDLLFVNSFVDFEINKNRYKGEIYLLNNKIKYVRKIGMLSGWRNDVTQIWFNKKDVSNASLINKTVRSQRIRPPKYMVHFNSTIQQFSVIRVPNYREDLVDYESTILSYYSDEGFVTNPKYAKGWYGRLMADAWCHTLNNS